MRSEETNVSKLILAAIISVVLALQSWTLTAVVDLKVSVAQLQTQMTALNAATKTIAIK